MGRGGVGARGGQQLIPSLSPDLLRARQEVAAAAAARNPGAMEAHIPSASNSSSQRRKQGLPQHRDTHFPERYRGGGGTRDGTGKGPAASRPRPRAGFATASHRECGAGGAPGSGRRRGRCVPAPSDWCAPSGPIWKAMGAGRVPLVRVVVSVAGGAGLICPVKVLTSPLGVTQVHKRGFAGVPATRWGVCAQRGVVCAGAHRHSRPGWRLAGGWERSQSCLGPPEQMLDSNLFFGTEQAKVFKFAFYSIPR